MHSGDTYYAEYTMGRRLAEVRHEIDSCRQVRARFYSGALVRLGAYLVSWGSRLQERYSTTASSATPQPSNRLAS